MPVIYCKTGERKHRIAEGYLATHDTVSRPHHNRAGRPPRLAAMIETPVYDLTNFKVHFGRLTVKAYTKGEHVLRFEAIVHNTKELKCRRGIDMFGQIVTKLAGMAERFCTALDCGDIGFLPDHPLDELPAASQIGATRVGGIDLNRARMRNALTAVLVLAAAPHGFTVTGFAEQVRVMTCASSAGNTSSTNPAGPAATTSHPTPPAPSPPYSRCATTSSHPTCRSESRKFIAGAGGTPRQQAPPRRHIGHLDKQPHESCSRHRRC